jgi:hypothetical protein
MVSPIYNLPTLDFVAGETQSFRFHLLTSAGSPYDANACDVAFAIINYTNKTGIPLVAKNVPVLAGEGGVPNVASVELLSEDTIYLYGRYVYQLSIRDAYGETEIPGLGIMNITKNIHQAFITG